MFKARNYIYTPGIISIFVYNSLFKANSKYQTPQQRQVDDNAFLVNFWTYFSSHSSVFIVNFEQVIAGYNKSVLK